MNSWSVIMGVGRGGRGPLTTWILKSLAKKGYFLSFEWEKTNFTTFNPPWKNFWKYPSVPPWKKSSRRPCQIWFIIFKEAQNRSRTSTHFSSQGPCSKQTTFITDHVRNRTVPLWTGLLWMWTVMNVVCYERVCYERGLFRVVRYKRVCFEWEPKTGALIWKNTWQEC